MPIPFSCECGKKLQAKDEFAGKRLKCPGCGKILTIPTPAADEPVAEAPAPPVTQRVAMPAPQPAADEPPPAPAPPPPAPTVVHFVCRCGRRLKARLADVGEVIDCPDCGRTLTIPAEDTDEPPPPPAPKPAPYGDGFLTQTITPWKDEATRRAGSDGPDPSDEKVSSRRGLAVGLLLLLLVGAGAALWFFGPQLHAWAARDQPKPAPIEAAAAEFDELEPVPADALAVLAVRPGAPAAPAALAPQAVAGLPLREVLATVAPIKRLTVVSLWRDPYEGMYFEPAPGERETWVLVRTSRPYDRLRMMNLLEQRGALLSSRTFRNQKFLVAEVPPPPPKGGFVVPKGFGPGLGKGKGGGPPPDKGKGFGPVEGPGQPPLGMTAPPGNPSGRARRTAAFYFAAPDVLVIADMAALRRYLDFGRLRKASKASLARVLNLARGDQPLVIGVNQTDFFLTPRARPAPDSAAPPLLPELARFTTATVTAHGGDEIGERIELSFDPRTGVKDAEAAADALNAWLASQEQARKAVRFVIAMRRGGGAVQAAVQMLGSAAPGQLSPLGPLHLAPRLPGLMPSPNERATLDRLREEEAFQKQLGPIQAQGNTLTLEVRLPATDAGRRLAAQLRAPYAGLAVNADVGKSRNVGKAPKLPKIP